ncbi:MAG: MarR family transcriptional regulator [Chloroflexota bacterium]|nr:MarR family transcriptional regulator [Chloroflexota bacterium]
MSSQTARRDLLIQAVQDEMTRGTGLAVLFSQAIADRVGLNPTDLEALEILLRQGPLTAGRLAELTGLTTGAITGVVDRLQRKSYARRDSDPNDRRRVIVHANLGDATRALLARYSGMERATRALMSRLPDEDLATILAFFQAANAVASAEIERLRQAPSAAPDRAGNPSLSADKERR